MGQKYKLEYDEREPKTKKLDLKLDKSIKEEALGDVYDVYGMISNVHSKITSMTRDYVLAHYTTDVINSKFPKFVREQRKTLRVIKSFLIIPKEELLRRYNNKDFADHIYKGLLSIYHDIEQLLLGELDEMVLISRAGQGEVTKAMLMHGKNKDERQEFEELMGEKRIRDGLFDRRKEKPR